MRHSEGPLPRQVKRERSPRRVRWAVLAGAITLAFVFSSDSPPAAPVTPASPRPQLSAEQMLGLTESEIDYGIAALFLTAQFEPHYDVDEGLRKLDEIAARIRELLAQQPDGNEPAVRIQAINTVLFREYGFRYDLDDFPQQTSEKRLLGNLLRRGKGTCANLPDLYYAVAERLGFPIYMVEAPAHAFLRYVLPDGSHINIEATASGGESSDEAYIAEMEIPKAAIEAGWLMRTLSRREALTLLIHESSWHFEQRGEFERVLATSATLRNLRPNHGGVIWNSAWEEAVKGRSLLALAQSDPPALPLAKEAFQRARHFAARAKELGVPKPDPDGNYVVRQEAIRIARTGERVPLPPFGVEWDPTAEIERLIAKPLPEPGKGVVAFRKQQAPDPFADFLESYDWQRRERQQRDAQARAQAEAEARVISAIQEAAVVNGRGRRSYDPSMMDGLPLQTRLILEQAEAVTQYNQTGNPASLEAVRRLMNVVPPRPTGELPR